MPIDPDALSSFATDFAKGMTSIRGRRVQRLLKREFAGADAVLKLQVGSGTVAALGLSATGAAMCGTDGRGKQVSVFRWRHGAAEALETRFDLLKDSLPILSSDPVPLASVCTRSHLCIVTGSVPRRARAWALRALQALA
jgi:hypothetical protein